ncbi:MAG: hypothetical protein IJR48_09405 [Oscillibacter sp.]|nr:hypothetical protein [Oscillibacter sp.]
MSRRHRLAAALLCALFVFGLARADAAHDGIYFVAVENMVLPLTGETMPFWNDGYLYISGDVFTGTARDMLGISRAQIGDAVLLYRGEQSLLFRRGYPYAQDSEENTYAPGMVWDGENGYVPASVVARYFNLLYSTTEVEHGTLVWLRSASFAMPERAFAKAATFQLDTAYQEYVRAMEPEPLPEPEPVPEVEPEIIEELPEVPEDVPEPVPPETSEAVTPSTPSRSPSTPSVSRPATPAAPSTSSTAKPATPSMPSTSKSTTPYTPSTSKSTTPSTSSATKSTTPSTSSTAKSTTPYTPSTSNSATTSAPSEPEPVTPSVEPEPDTAGQRIYICLRGNGVTASLLDALDRYEIRATVFCDEGFLSEQGDLLRRIAATGHRIGLYVPAGDAAPVLERLEACNLLLRRTTMEKTRLVFVDGGGEELLHAVQNAGFLCLRPTLDRTQAPLRTSRQAAELLRAVSGQPETLSLWLGGTVSRSGLNAFISDALDVRDAFHPWTETAPT